MNSRPNPIDWTLKSLAFLHDPPEKAYDFSKAHVDRANVHARALGLNLGLLTQKDADWTAAAADRFVFPDPAKVRELGHKIDQGWFRHPVSGELMEMPIPDEATAQSCLSDALPGQQISDPRDRFFVLWRTWMTQAAAQKNGCYLPYLPADTRIPDGSIWNHMSVVSALEGTRNSDGKLAPALMLFQLGPVQEFIAQARSTRDLWSGSYLLSWLTAHGIKALTDELGPDAVVFPSLRGQPLFDWLNRDALDKAIFEKTDGKQSRSFWAALGLEGLGQEQVLTPNLPNRFLAIVPAGYDGGKVVKAVEEEWRRIGEAVWKFLEICPLPAGAKNGWDYQLVQFLQPTWQRWDWQSFSDTLQAGDLLPAGRRRSARNLCAAAEAIPSTEQDSRCYPASQRADNLGLLWSDHFQLVSHRLDARRACRNFDAWEASPEFRERDALSGKEEALMTKEWLEQARRMDPLRHYFRSSQLLGAVNLLKRLWHVAYLHKAPHKFKRRGTKFESVIDVAAAGWKETVKLRLNDTSLWMSFRGFMETASKVSRTRDWEGKRLSAAKETDFISDIPAEFLVPEGWEDDPDDSPDDRKLTIAARDALREFHQAAGLKNPPSYYAIIALDGDEIGKFLSGEKAPEVGKLLSRKANEYFSRIAPDWLKAKRPLSPSYHLGFSEALGNFGLYAARRVVEAHHGQLIYSGGDDVLAAVPADEAFACVRGLRWAFQGSHQLAQQYQEQFAPAPVEGMIQLAAPDNHEPSWPLLVPGSAMTVSAGIVIAHVKTPLQDCVQAAHAAEKRAKRARDAGGFARNAVALTLLKRSGETIEWGASFAENGGLELLMEFQRLYRLPKGIAGKFPSRIAGLLSRFDSVPEGLKLTSEIREVVIREIEWAWDQMESAKVLQGNKAGFFKLIDGYLNHLIEHGRPLADVWKLFGTEAFLKRQSV